MHFPKHWRLVREGGVCAWGFSDESAATAEADGKLRVGRIRQWLASNLQGERGPYGYPDRPMREEVLREFRGADGELTAVVSRNSYGCLVLNTAAALFVDVDEPESGLIAGVARLFRGGKSFEAGVLAKLDRWIQSHPDAGWRAYRTRAGIRLLATSEPVRPDDPVCQESFTHFGADRLYRRLCANQQCFRARLTPKPWRCGHPKPSQRWPWRDAAAERAFRDWQREYAAAAEQHATCRLLGQYGKAEIHAELSPLVSYHDEVTRVSSKLALA